MKQQFTVLGGSGFVGKRLVRKLAEKDADIFVPSKRQTLEIFKRPLGVVFYCIGLTADYVMRPFDTVEAHVSYLARLLEQSQFDHIVYLSSTRLYDGLSVIEGSGTTPLCFCPKTPRHLYDLSKALGENLCQTTVPSRSSIARLSCVYDAAPDSPGFLSELLHRLRHERSVTLNSAPGYCRDYITLDDTVDSLIAMGEQYACDIFNVASGRNTFNQDIADVMRPFGVDIQFSLTGEPIHLARCNIANLRALGVSPADTLTNLEEFARNLTV